LTGGEAASDSSSENPVHSGISSCAFCALSRLLPCRLVAKAALATVEAAAQAGHAQSRLVTLIVGMAAQRGIGIQDVGGPNPAHFRVLPAFSAY